MAITLASDEPLDKMFLRFVDKIDEEVKGAVDDAMEYGADIMRDLIEHSGTGRTWDESWDSMPNAYWGRYQSSPGRVASGDMRDAVSHESGMVDDGYEGAFGWVGAADPYWLAQEHGFRHNISREQIEGMNALAESADLTMKFLDDALDKRLRNV